MSLLNLHKVGQACAFFLPIPVRLPRLPRILPLWHVRVHPGGKSENYIERVMLLNSTPQVETLSVVFSSIHHYLLFTHRKNETTVLFLHLRLTFTWIPNSRSSLMSSMFSFSMAAIKADRSKGSTQLILRISGWSLFSCNNLQYFVIFIFSLYTVK